MSGAGVLGGAARSGAGVAGGGVRAAQGDRSPFGLPAATAWQAANRAHLEASLAIVRARVAALADGAEAAPDELDALASARDEAASAAPSPTALARVTELFGLTAGERDGLLVCAAAELLDGFDALCERAQAGRAHGVTFGLALLALPDLDWPALAPDAALRRFRLVELGDGPSLTRSPLRIAERLLHYLAAVDSQEPRLAGLVAPIPATESATAAQLRAADAIATLWRAATGGRIPPVQLAGLDDGGSRTVAATAAGALGMELHAIDATALPSAPDELEELAALWEREALLRGAALLIERADVLREEAPWDARVARLVARLHCPVLVAGELGERGGGGVRVDVEPSDFEERRGVWRAVLGGAAASLNGELDAIAGQFRLSPDGIRRAAAAARSARPGDLWRSARREGRQRLDGLAQRLEARARWSDLILPAPQLAVLHEVEAQVRGRAIVDERWGFAAQSARGLGIAALFAGPSGTGKTLAAEVLAGELSLDLYRIDLSQMVSKYIGETEKNLRRVFDAAEASGAVLLFDEADALFGKRTEVRDSHDRYANLEVSYLLQRTEAYRGLVVLTTNLKSALDPAFLRRIRFVVQFPFPDVAERLAIWRGVFPAQAPLDGLDFERLAGLSAAGGNIRNIALGAAFLAAAEHAPISMRHLLQATRTEYAKLERPIAEAEVAGWA